MQLAGNAYYFGKLYEKPTIGDANRDIDNEDIKRANTLLYVSSFLGAVLFVAVRTVLLAGILFL